MKYMARSGVALLLLVVILVGMLPATALAADGERVLTSIRHSAAAAAVNVADSTSATLTVPYSYSGAVNLSQGLDISYSTSTYSSASPSFPSGSTAEVNGPSVSMVVTYQRKGDATFYKTSYTILVTRAEYVPAAFSGTITKSASPARPATFAEADFVDKYTKNDGASLGSVVITGSNPSFGTLKIGSAAYSPGDPIALTSIRSGSLTFAATGTGTADFIVEAYGSDAAKTKVEGSVLLRVSAVSVAPSFSGTISKSVTLPASLTFAASDFTGKYAKNDGGALASITITGSNPSFGKLRLGSSDYSAGTSVPISDVSSGRLTFVTTGAGTVSYSVRAYASGDATTLIGSATLTIAVQASTAADIAYMAEANTPVTFDTSDFNNVCGNLTGENLNYVRFTLPSSSYGKLYYDYTSSSDYGSTVSSSVKYYRSSSLYLAKVTFVPKSGYFGAVSIAYTGYNIDGQSFTGKVTILVLAVADDITYTTDENAPIAFKASDFSYASDDATDGTLSYVKFKLPSSTYGKLYYDYASPSDTGSSVSTSAKYYRSSSPSLSKATFVPKYGYTGTVSISYTGYNTDGDAYLGTVKVVVREGDGSSAYFDDVGAGYWWASEAIDYLYTTGVATGVGPGTYNPSASISRGDFMLMLCRAFDLKANVAGNFSDVPAGSYYFDAIAVAKALGIATGDGGTFRPTAAVTRQDAMVLVARTLAVASETIPAGNWSDLAGFSDTGDVSDYAVSAASSLVRAKIIVGTAGRLNPKGSVSRSEMAVILHRVLTMP